MKNERIISEECYSTLKNQGSVVPRDRRPNGTGEPLTGFKVGSEYIVKSSIEDTPIKCRCTQNCPTHLIKIN